MTLPDPRFAEIKLLAEACQGGPFERTRELLARHLNALNGPDYDTRFFYPESCLWSPLGLAARNGQKELVRWLLDQGANPVPYEVAGNTITSFMATGRKICGSAAITTSPS